MVSLLLHLNDPDNDVKKVGGALIISLPMYNVSALLSFDQYDSCFRKEIHVVNIIVILK